MGGLLSACMCTLHSACMCTLHIRRLNIPLGIGLGPDGLPRTPSGRSSQLIELAELMGHSNLSQVRKYALSDAERVRARVAKL